MQRFTGIKVVIGMMTQTSHFMLLMTKGLSVIKWAFVLYTLLNHMFQKIIMMLNLGDTYVSKFFDQLYSLHISKSK